MENHHVHHASRELQDTSVAVWDLGESIRSANMTSGDMMTTQLEDLGKSLETLVVELTRFFVNVDGDIDRSVGQTDRERI